MYSVKIRNSIMIAHSLPNEFFGPAQHTHGATYTIDVSFHSENLNEYNVVIDIGLAHKMLKEVLAPLNYQNLDDLEVFQGVLTTTEFMAKYIHDCIKEKVSSFFEGRISVMLRETHDAWAGYEG